MTRTLRSKSFVISVCGLFAAGALAIQSPAHGSSPDQALAQSFRRGSDGLDPVLSFLSAGRLVRQVSALAPGEVELPPVPLGFAFRGDQLARFDVTSTVAGAQEIAAFVARLRSRGDDASGAYTVYTLPPIREARESAARRGVIERADGDGPLDSVLIVPTGTKVELVGAVFDGDRLHAKTGPLGSAYAQATRCGIPLGLRVVRAGRWYRLHAP